LGTAVALSADGNTLSAGAQYDNSEKGAVWVFVRSNGAWTQQQKITVTDGIDSPYMGTSVSLSSDGNILAAGGPYDGSSTQPGAVWIFTRTGTIWTEQQKITPSDAIGSAFMGTSVALSSDGKTLATGGIGDNTNKGAVWIFTNYDNTWLEQKKITVTDNIGNANLGYTVALSAQGNTLASAGYEDNGRNGATWIFV
jgi:WD40 repeat protein